MGRGFEMCCSAFIFEAKILFVCCLVRVRFGLSDKERWYEEVTGALELMSNN